MADYSGLPRELGVRAGLLDTIGECRVLAQAAPEETLGWGQIGSSAAVTFVGLFVIFLLAALLPLSKKLSDALAPFAKDREPGLWPWMRNAFFEDVDKPMSLDGRVLLRYCMFGRNFCLVGTLISVALLPSYALWHGNEYVGENDFMRFTVMSFNFDNSRHVQKLWLVIVAMYVLVYVFCWLLEREWRHFIGLRRDHFLDLAICPPHMFRAKYQVSSKRNVHEAQSAHTVLVEQVPKHVVTEEDLRNAFERVFPGGVVCCRLVEMPDEVPKGCCTCCKRCLHWCQNMLHKLESVRPSTGFVTLDTMSKRAIALQADALFSSRHSKEGFKDWVLMPAPQVSDLIWENIHNDWAGIERRASLFHLALVGGFVFWSSPLLGLMTLTNPAFLHKQAPETMENFLRDAPFMYDFVTASLPMLLIWAVQNSLPALFEYCAIKFEGRKQRSEVARRVVSRAFVYWAAIYYFLAFGGTAALTVWTAYFRTGVKSPLCALSALGHALPQVAVYYVAQVLNEIWLLPWFQIQFPVLWNTIRGQATKAIQCDFKFQALRVASILNFVNMLGVSCPIIMPFGAMYFALATCVFRWSFQNTYGTLVPGCRLREGEYDIQGGLFFELFHCAMGGMLLGVGATMGFITTQIAVALAEHDDSLLIGSCSAMLIVMSGLFLKIGAFWWRCWRTYQRWSEVMTYEDAASIDRDPGQAAIIAAFDKDYYTDAGKDSDNGNADVASNGDDDAADVAL